MHQLLQNSNHMNPEIKHSIFHQKVSLHRHSARAHNLTTTPGAEEAALDLRDVDTEELGCVRGVRCERDAGDGGDGGDGYRGLVEAATVRGDAAVPFEGHFDCMGVELKVVKIR